MMDQLLLSFNRKVDSLFFTIITDKNKPQRFDYTSYGYIIFMTYHKFRKTEEQKLQVFTDELFYADEILE